METMESGILGLNIPNIRQTALVRVYHLLHGYALVVSEGLRAV